MAECPLWFSLVLWSAGDLPEAEGRAMEAHVRNCAACRSALAEFGANVDAYESRRDEHLAMLRARLAGEHPPPAGSTSWRCSPNTASPKTAYTNGRGSFSWREEPEP